MESCVVIWLRITLFYSACSMSFVQTQCAVKLEITHCLVELRFLPFDWFLLSAGLGVYLCLFMPVKTEKQKPMFSGLHFAAASLKHFSKPCKYLDILSTLVNRKNTKLNVIWCCVSKLDVFKSYEAE